MTKDQIERLVSDWLNTTLDEWENLRTNGPELDDDQRDGQMDILGDQLEDAWADLTFNRLSGVEKIADELLVGQGEKLQKDSTAYRKLCRELLKAKMELLKTELKRMDGDYSTTPTASLVQHNAVVYGVTPVPAVPTKPFSEVSAAYLKEFSNRQPRTQAMIRSGFAKFLEATGGDKPVGNITKDHCRMYKDSMTNDGLVAATVNKHLHSMSHCLTWSHGQGFLPEDWKNPVAGLRIAKSIVRAQKVKVIPFTDEELSVIFSSKEFVGWKVEHPERYSSRCSSQRLEGKKSSSYILQT